MSCTDVDSVVGIEFGLIRPGSQEPYQRISLHPDDVSYMLCADNQEHLSLGDFIAQADFKQAKETLRLSRCGPNAAECNGICKHARTCPEHTL